MWPPPHACLTCDKFATDASYLTEHEHQLARLDALIEQRKALFRAKTGHEMADGNVWLGQRLTERRALQRIIAALNSPALAGERAGVQGAGTTAHAAYQPTQSD